MRYRLPRLTLSQRLLFALGMALSFSVAVGGYVVHSTQELAELLREEHRNALVAEEAYELRIEALRVILFLHQYRDRREPALLIEMEAARKEAAAKRVQLRRHARLPEVLEALERYEALLPERMRTRDAAVAAIQSGAKGGDIPAQLARLDHLDFVSRELLRKIVERTDAELDQVLARGEQARARLLRNSLTLLVLGAGIVVVLLYSVIAGGVTRRLNQLTGMARQIAAGDYSRRTFIAGGDEISVLANEFNEMAGKLAEFDKVKEEFVALASHQLRTPATAVKGNLGMLLEGYCGELSAEQREVLKDANDSNERQLAVIDDMLWVARTDSGRLVLSKSDTDICRLIGEVVAEQMHVARQRRQALTLKKPKEAVVLHLDAQKIRMVCENLLSNASKYTPEGGRIEVALARHDGGVRLAVKDNGVGIAREDLSKLFAKFSRIGNELSDQVGGTGLGLYLAYEIVKLHGGSIAVDSQPGAGTTFAVTLPNEGAPHGKNSGG